MELWKSVINYAGVYEVSNKGEIRRCDNYHKSPRKYLRPAKNHHGYLNVSLSKDGVCKTFFVHKIVCESFNGVRKKGMTINHINGNKSDNRPENLEYMSHYDNIQHSIHIINTFSLSLLGIDAKFKHGGFNHG